MPRGSPRTGVGRETGWVAGDGRSYDTMEQAIAAQFGEALPAPPKPPRLVKIHNLPAWWIVDDGSFDTSREALEAYEKSKSEYVSAVGGGLNSLRYPEEFHKEYVLHEVTGRENRDCRLALRLRGNDMQSAVKWLVENPDYSGRRAEDMLSYGGMLGYAIHLYLIISHLSSLAADHLTRAAMDLARPRAPTGFFNWFQDQFVLSYTDPTSVLARKLIFTAPQSALLAFGIFLAILGIYEFIAKRTDLLVFQGRAGDVIPFAIGAVSLFGALTLLWGGYGLLATGVSQFGSIL